MCAVPTTGMKASLLLCEERGEADKEVTESDLAIQLLQYLGNGENLLVCSAYESIGEVQKTVMHFHMLVWKIIIHPTCQRKINRS